MQLIRREHYKVIMAYVVPLYCSYTVVFVIAAGPRCIRQFMFLGISTGCSDVFESNME